MEAERVKATAEAMAGGDAKEGMAGRYGSIGAEEGWGLGVEVDCGRGNCFNAVPWAGRRSSDDGTSKKSSGG